MPLVLEIEHLLGVSFAAESQASTAPDWPPQPDRVFSALVAAWGARGERTDERLALEWLEAQPTPDIGASSGLARTPAIVFVPPNDPETGRVGDRSVMPSLRRRQPRRFPAFRPDNPVMQLVWRDVEPGSDVPNSLNALAHDIPYIGHSSSLTRCRFLADRVPERTMGARRRVYRGRLVELERSYYAGRRPNPGADAPVAAIGVNEPKRSIFAGRWLVLEHVEGQMPDLRGAALVGNGLRAALMSGYRQTGRGDAIPTILSGHDANGSPTAEPHLAIAPLAFFGSQFSDGRVVGFALIPPDSGEFLEDENFRSALRGVAAWNKKEERRELRVTAHGFDIVLSPTRQRELHSLDPEPYVTVAKTWASCTPIVLDRHLKAKGNAEREAEVTELLHQACMNIGLPRPAHAADSKHSAVAGAPPAYPSGRAPRWTGWRLPKSLATRQFSHALFQFNEPVRGPVILGAGRFAGLGPCRALDPERS